MTRHSRTAWIALTLLALLLGLTLLFFTRPTSPHVPVTAATPGALIPPSLPPPAIPSPTQPPALTAASSNQQRDDLCGVPAPLQVRQKDETIGAHVARVTKPTLDRWRQTLADSASPRLQAIALALADVTAEGDPVSLEAPRSEAHDQLILRALDGMDPAIYALALGQCGAFQGPMPPGSCQGLSFEQWARMDADNAIPWLWLATRSQDDPAKLQESLQKAASASRFDTYLDAVIREPLGYLPADRSDLDQVTAGSNLLSLSRLGEPLVFTTVCSAEAIAQPDRRQLCESIAHRYARDSKSLIGAFTASRLGSALGWSKDAIAALDDEAQQGLHTNSMLWGGSDEDRYRCELVHRRARYFSLLEAAGGSERAAFKQYTASAVHP